MQRGLTVHPAGGKRALLCAAHDRVDIGFIPLVERPRRTRAERDAQDRGEADHGMDADGRGEHAAQPGEHDERHHPGFGQRQKVAPFGGGKQGRRSGHGCAGLYATLPFGESDGSAGEIETRVWWGAPIRRR